MNAIAVTEDVLGPAYEDLGRRWGLVRDGEAWRSEDRRNGLLADAEAVIVRNRTQVDEAFFNAAPRLKVVARAGVGLDNIDLPAADRAGVVIVAPLGANALSVAEHALTLALALSKNLVKANASTRAGHWDRTPTRELRGKTWGLLSAGATARCTARLARAFGMETVAFDPFIDPGHPELDEIGIRLASLEETLAGADVLSVHLPHTKETHHMLDAQKLALLPKGALLINVGRGEVLDEEALLDALNKHGLAGAALDVRETEPPVPAELERHPNVLLTPHVAGIAVEAQERIGKILCTEIDAVLSGRAATRAVGAHSVPLERAAP